MGTYTSKYTGEEIDNLLGQVESGGGSGSGYSETELLTSYVEYALGGTDGKTIGQDLVLNDDISNYDEIVFRVGNASGTDIKHPQENSVHVSNIVYNNSNTNVWDGSRFSIYTISTDTLAMGLWFKDTKTIRIHNTFSSLSSVPSGAKLRLVSIKGIKY